MGNAKASNRETSNRYRLSRFFCALFVEATQATAKAHAFQELLSSGFCLEAANNLNSLMETENIQDRGGGGTPPCAGFTSNVLPEAKSSQTGVSTRNVLQGKHWFTLRCTYGREQTAYEYLVQQGIEAYHPTLLTKKKVNGKERLVEESRIPNIFFAYGTFDALKDLVYDNVRSETQYLRFYYNHHHDGSKEPLVVPERQMNSLRIICGADAEDIIVQPNAIAKFRQGQRVIVREGTFAGVEGIVARHQGQQRVGIVIEGLLCATTAYIPSAFLEPVHTVDDARK